MHIQKLEIFGFKTFPDKTILQFSPGITCIVGPNGCGKSNIVDAILWVIGEQSAKSLRSGKMEDVIFYGSESRKGLGMAEVTLTMGGIKEQLPDQYREYSQIEITRRLYRSGESEYLINRTPVRLKDIKDLLMDMGIGFRGHNIIEQGRIERLITSTPEERRILIEDTAGIIKFKFRKAETLKKLEATQQNLIRVKDIIWEVGRQIKSLEKQVRKAKEYENILKKIRQIEISINGIKYDKLKQQLQDLIYKKENISQHLMSIKTDIARYDSEMERLREELLEIERFTKALKDKSIHLDMEINRLEGRLLLLDTNFSHYKKECDRLRGEIADLEAQKRELLKTRSFLQREGEEIDRRIDVEENNLKEVEYIFEQKSKEFTLLQEKLERLRKEMLSTVGAISGMRNQYASQKARLSEIERICARITRERDEYEKSLHDIEMKISHLSDNEHSKKEELMRSKERLQNLHDEFTHLESELIDLDKTLAGKREALHRKESRLSSLEEMASNYAGYEEGVRTIMLSKRRMDFTGIRGLLAEFVDILPSCDPLIEKNISLFLDDLMQSLIIDDMDDMKKILDFLKSRKERATFILNSQIPDPIDVPSPDITGVIGPVTSFIKWDTEYETLIKALIGGALVVDDLDTAFLLLKNRYGHPVVTLRGEIIYPHGRIVWGIKNGYMTILSNKKELNILRKEIRSLRERIGNDESQMETLEEKRTKIFKEIEALKQKVQKIEIDLDHLSREKDRLLQEKVERLSYLDTLKQEIGEIKRDEREIKGTIETCIRDMARMEENQKRIEEDLQKLTALQHTEREEWEKAHKSVSAKELEIVSLREKREAMRNQFYEMEKQIKDIENSIVQRTRLLGEIKKKEEKDLKEREDLESILQQLIHQKEDINRDIPIHEEKREDIEGKIRSCEQSIKEKRKKVEETEETLKKLEIGETEIKINMDHIWETIFNTYKCNIEEEIPRIDEDYDMESWEETLSKLKDRRDRIGPVNMASIQEYEELNKRYEFLTTQERDLKEACSTLSKTIGKIDRTTKDLFMETFHRVNERFSYLFKLFFQGGEASLILTDESNLLETGVDIRVRPPGKRIHQLALLSGGEKALTSLSLVFATFLARPTPFCILDEIDAPLDEPNTDRFIEVLNNMIDFSQFIIVTHNRRTMEAAHVLYGVTMEEPGISKVVAVDLTRKEELMKNEALSSAMGI